MAEILSAEDVAATVKLVEHDLVRGLAVSHEHLRAERDAHLAEIHEAGNLLAVLHRDGGHHTAEVGFVQSCKDGMQAWWDRAEMIGNLQVERDAIRQRVEAWEAFAKYIVEDHPFVKVVKGRVDIPQAQCCHCGESGVVPEEIAHHPSCLYAKAQATLQAEHEGGAR